MAFSVFFVLTNHLDMERDLSLFSLHFYGKKKEKKLLNRHNFLTYLYMPILSRDVLCIYCELLKM